MKDLAFIAAAALYLATYIGLPVMLLLATIKFVFA